MVSLAASPAISGPNRIDISPALMVNLGSGHSGAVMGAAVTGDIFFKRNLAVRTTVGFTKDRYFPEDQSYSDADYGFWLSIAPYAELSVGSVVRPYVAFLGSFSVGSSGNYAGGTFVDSRAPVNRLQQAAGSHNAYSLGATVGTKVKLQGPFSLYAEVSHHFYSSLSRAPQTFDNWLEGTTLNYDWDEHPTYMALGITYSLALGNK